MQTNKSFWPKVTWPKFELALLWPVCANCLDWKPEDLTWQITLFAFSIHLSDSFRHQQAYTHEYTRIRTRKRTQTHTRTHVRALKYINLQIHVHTYAFIQCSILCPYHFILQFNSASFTFQFCFSFRLMLLRISELLLLKRSLGRWHTWGHQSKQTSKWNKNEL